MSHRLTAFPSVADRWIAFSVVAVLAVCLSPILYTVFLDPKLSLSSRLGSGLLLLILLGTVASIFWSCTDLAAGGVIFRQGLYFRAAVPYANIKSVKAVPAPAGLWVPGVRRELGGRGVRIVLSSRNLIELQLKEPQRFVVFGFVPVARAERVLFNAPSPEQAVRQITERIGSDGSR